MYYFLEWLEKPATAAEGLFQLIEEGIITIDQYVDISPAIGLCAVS